MNSIGSQHALAAFHWWNTSATGSTAAGTPVRDTDARWRYNAPGSATGGHDGGSSILQALAQALESLGLALQTPATSAAAPVSTTAPVATTPAPITPANAAPASTPAAKTTAVSTTPNTPASSAASTTPATVVGTGGDPSGTPATGGNIRQDILQLFHALFEAVRAENILSPSGTAGSSSGRAASFASGLAALISQVSGGSVPAQLQTAFSQLVSDLKSIGGTSASAATASTGSTASSLLSFLNNLQQDLGYGGAAAGAGSTGNLIATTA
jgi:hypothetical protein